VQRVERFRTTRLAVESPNRRFDLPSGFGRLLHQPRQPAAGDLLLALPLRHALRLRLRIDRHFFERRNDAEELVELRVIRAERFAERLNRRPVHLRRLPRVDRQLLLEVLEDQHPLAERELELAAFEDLAVLIAQDGQQQPIAQLRLHRRPFDVEERRGHGARAVFEQVAPPRVGRRADAHVVGDEVHHVAHALVGDGGREGVVRFASANLRVDLVVVADVVAVRAARFSREVRRRVDGADTQP
jgi:hypothetical protein